MSIADGADFQTSEQLCENHQNLRNLTKERFKVLLLATSLLSDSDCDVTCDKIDADIAIINGTAIKLYVIREPFQMLKVVVSRFAKIYELKSAIQRSFNALQKRTRQKSDKESSKSLTSGDEHKRSNKIVEPIANISWKYIWRTYYLRSNGTALLHDEKTLTDYGICTKSVLSFEKKAKIQRKIQAKR